MYRFGTLPSGEPMKAFIRGDVEVDSLAFSCSSCHLRAGLGSYEGGVITPPTTGVKLYQPYRRPPSYGDTLDQGGRYIYAKTVIERPAYNRESLAKALRFGIDPAGQTFNDVMPRYPLSDTEMNILIDYLENLSASPSPGATTREFRFATIITEEVAPAERQALLNPLQGFIRQKNQQNKIYGDFLKMGYTPTPEMKYAFRNASLDVWDLKGPPSTWRQQLDKYYAEKPVFAILGGISTLDWRPIHEFCEEMQLPCLFPITEFPVVSEPGWYTYYFNKGYVQEAEAVAGYLNRLDTLKPDSRVLQLYQDSPAGKTLAEGFQKKWELVGRPSATSFILTREQTGNPVFISELLTREKPEVLILWTDGTVAPLLPEIAKRLPAGTPIYLSSTSLGRSTLAIPDEVRKQIFLTFPYRLTPYVGPKTGGYDSKVPIYASANDFGNPRVASRTLAMLQQSILQGFNLINDNLYRDHLLDIMSMQMDVTVRDYERLSFGPSQRYASKGCYIIQLGTGTTPDLIPKSDWVVY